MGRLSRLILDYVANVESSPEDSLAPEPALADPRVNHGDRELLDWVSKEFEVRGYPEALGREFLHDLRVAIRRLGPITAVAAASARSAERAPATMGDDEGIDRDATS